MELAGALRLSSDTVHKWSPPGIDRSDRTYKVSLIAFARYIYENRRRYFSRLVQAYPELEGVFNLDEEILSIGQLVRNFDMIPVDTSDLDSVRKGMDIAEKGIGIVTKEMRLQAMAGELVRREDVEAQQRALIALLEDNLGPAFIQQLATALAYAPKMTEGELYARLTEWVGEAVNTTVDELHEMFELNQQPQLLEG